MKAGSSIILLLLFSCAAYAEDSDDAARCTEQLHAIKGAVNNALIREREPVANYGGTGPGWGHTAESLKLSYLGADWARVQLDLAYNKTCFEDAHSELPVLFQTLQALANEHQAADQKRLDRITPPTPDLVDKMLK